MFFDPFQIHHVLLQELGGHSILRLLGDRFKLNDIRNLMALPSKHEPVQEINSSPHTGGHLQSYKNGFSEYLSSLEKHPSFEAAQANDAAALDELTAELYGFLAVGKYALANGHLLTNTPTGMTRESANAQNDAWFANWRAYAAEHRDGIQQMQDTVGQLRAAGRPDDALYWPVLSPTRDLSLADRIAILDRYRQWGSPISLQFTAAGATPGLRGFVPSLVDTRLPGFVSPQEGLNQPEGFSPTSPLQTYGLPGFPVLSPDWQRRTQLPPSAATPTEPQVLQFHPDTGELLKLSDGSPVMGPNPYNQPPDPRALYALPLVLAAVSAPELWPLLPAWAQLLGTLGLSTAATTSAASAGPRQNSGPAAKGIFGTGAPPYDPFNTTETSNLGNLLELRSGARHSADNSINQEPVRGDTFADRFGIWPPKSASSTFSQGSSREEAATTAVASEGIRRLTRVNASNAGNAFVSGTSPIPYLPPSELSGGLGSWNIPSDQGPPMASNSTGALIDHPSYLIPPPIWGLEERQDARGDADDWFSRRIQPLMRQSRD